MMKKEEELLWDFKDAIPKNIFENDNSLAALLRNPNKIENINFCLERCMEEIVRVFMESFVTQVRKSHESTKMKSIIISTLENLPKFDRYHSKSNLCILMIQKLNEFCVYHINSRIVVAALFMDMFELNGAEYKRFLKKGSRSPIHYKDADINDILNQCCNDDYNKFKKIPYLSPAIDEDIEIQFGILYGSLVDSAIDYLPATSFFNHAMTYFMNHPSLEKDFMYYATILIHSLKELSKYFEDGDSTVKMLFIDNFELCLLEMMQIENFINEV